MKEQALRLDRLRRPTAYAALVGLAISLTSCAGENQPGETTVPARLESPAVTPTPAEVTTDAVPTTATPTDSLTETSDETAATTTPPAETITEMPTETLPTTTAPEDIPEPSPTSTSEPTEQPTTATPPPETSPTTEEPPTETAPPPEAEPTPTSKDRVVDCMVERCIALTFDDGPGPYTDDLLDHLDDYGAKATFFLVGNRVSSYSAVANRIDDSGHQLGNHSWEHKNLTTMSLEAADDDIRDTQDAIDYATDTRPTIMRPPGGATNQTLVDYIDLPQILWSVDTLDWKHRDTDYVTDNVLENAKRGDIVLMHDIHASTVNAVPDILDGLTSDGYQLVTIDTLLGENLPTGIYRRQDL